MTTPLSKEEHAHSTVCAWEEDEDGNLNTDCGECFYMVDGTPPENRMRFCCYCGKMLAYCSYQADFEDDDDETDD